MSDLASAAANIVASMPAGQGSEPGPDSTSGDYALMKPHWDKVAAFDGGVAAMRKASKQYLPRFELESDEDYKTRVDSSPFTNVYEDVAHNLAAKPFTREVAFEDPDEVGEDFKALYENIDGRGNNMHVFAEGLFEAGVSNALEWILVDHTKLPPLAEGRTVRSLDEERTLGARPYWVHVSGPRVLAAYSDMVRGEEVLIHVRISEPTLVREKYKESIKQRVRIFERLPYDDEDGQVAYEPATWRVEEKQKDTKTGKEVWVVIDQGSVHIGVIPMIPFRTGKRIGSGWAVKPPLGMLADMQLDAYQQESNLRNIELLTCYPMLTGNGVAPPAPTDPGGAAPATAKAPRLAVGPRAVLWAPPSPNGGPPGSWAFIEPASTSVTTLSNELAKTWCNMREIGMQPMAESNITVITSANVSVKAKSVLQAWALRLKDALEQALELTALWLGKTKEDAPGADVYKDFGVDLQSGKEMDTLVSAKESGALSGETLRAEMKRRNVLSDSFNEQEEQERLAQEAVTGGTGMEGEEDIDPVTGQPLSPDNDDEPAQEPVDPGRFADASEIDDETLLRLFGTTNAGAV